MRTETVQGWGRATGSHAQVTRPADPAEWKEQLAAAEPRGVIARSGGCGYGDAAQNAGGVVALTSAGSVDRLAVDDDGTVLVDAGTTLGSLVRALGPLGWTLPVVPGTGRVTVGGAIAADVHGKNHVHTGAFGAHVKELTLLDPGPGEVVLGPGSDPGAFRATVDGLGLTGVIGRARLGLVPLDSWLMRCTDSVVGDLDTMLTRLPDAARTNAYAVAWLDGRRGGVISTAQPVRPGRVAPGGGGRPVEPRLRLPAMPGAGVGTPAVVAAANRARRLAARARPHRIRTLPEVFHPLDFVPDWPRLHGRRGLVQYQFVVPFGAEDVLVAALSTAVRPTLAVLNVFGRADDAPLSFPMPGRSVALDFPAVPKLAAVLDELVAEAGGRVYLVKASHLRPRSAGSDVSRARALAGRTGPARPAPEDGVRSGLAARAQPCVTGSAARRPSWSSVAPRTSVARSRPRSCPVWARTFWRGGTRPR